METLLMHCDTTLLNHPMLALSAWQEKGWDVDQTIEKLLKNGTRISAEAHEIVRIPGLLTDADMIGTGAGAGAGQAGRMPLRWGQSANFGARAARSCAMAGCTCCPAGKHPAYNHNPRAGDIVWAYDRAAGCWWPAEKLDPLNMPAGALSGAQCCQGAETV